MTNVAVEIFDLLSECSCILYSFDRLVVPTSSITTPMKQNLVTQASLFDFFFQVQAQGSTKVYPTYDKKGRYVYVRLLGDEARFLTLCEVEVRHDRWCHNFLSLRQLRDSGGVTNVSPLTFFPPTFPRGNMTFFEFLLVFLLKMT